MLMSAVSAPSGMLHGRGHVAKTRTSRQNRRKDTFKYFNAEKYVVNSAPFRALFGEMAQYVVKLSHFWLVFGLNCYLCLNIKDIKRHFIMSEKYKLPSYFRQKYQLIATVTFTAFFSLVFMLVSIPFSHNVWFELGASEAFLFTAAFFVIGLFVIIFSKRLMYATRMHDMNYLQYVLWNIGEVVVICLLYAAFSVKGDSLGIIELYDSSFVDIFLNAFVYCFVSLIIPYIIAGMYFAIIDKNNTIRLMNYANVVSDEPILPKDEKKITLFDNSGVLKMQLSLSSLYYIESDDNYIIVWYTDSKGDMKRYMLRCRLKTVEESFMGSSLIRCHRKYIVNMDKVKVLRKEKDGYELEIDNDVIPPIAITRTYADNVLRYLKSEETGKPQPGKD